MTIRIKWGSDRVLARRAIVAFVDQVERELGPVSTIECDRDVKSERAWLVSRFGDRVRVRWRAA